MPNMFYQIKQHELPSQLFFHGCRSTSRRRSAPCCVSGSPGPRMALVTFQGVAPRDRERTSMPKPKMLRGSPLPEPF